MKGNINIMFKNRQQKHRKMASKFRLLASVGIAIVLFTGMGMVFSGKAALADTIIPLNGSVNASTYIASLNTTANLPNGSFVGSVDLTNDQITGNLSLPAGSINTNVFGFVPMSATFEMVPVGSVTGTVDLKTLSVNVTSVFNIKLTSAEVFGLPFNIVGNQCVTSTPVTANLNGKVNSNLSVDLTGTYTIPSFENCGFSTFLVNLLVPGGGNTITAQIS